MTKLLAVFAIAMALAYISEKNTRNTIESGQHYTPRKDWAFVGLVIVLTLFAGLRTSYNDTWIYIQTFDSSPGVSSTGKSSLESIGVISSLIICKRVIYWSIYDHFFNYKDSASRA